MEVQLLIPRREAAELLNMSLSHFQRHVQAQLPCVRSGQLRLYRHTDVEHWIEDQLHLRTVIPSCGDIGFTEAHERFVADCWAGAALNKARRSLQAEGDREPRLLSEEVAGRDPQETSRGDPKGGSAGGRRRVPP